MFNCTPSTYPNSYPRFNPVISPMTSKIIDLRNQALYNEQARYQKSLGPEHWTNFPSGKQIFDKFKKEFPNVVRETSNVIDYSHKTETPSKYFKTSIYSGTAFDPCTRQSQYQTPCYSARPAPEVSSVVRHCKLQEAKRHVETADILLKLA